MVAVSGLVGMLVTDNIDGGQYGDKSDENRVSVVGMMVAVVVVAGMEAES